MSAKAFDALSKSSDVSSVPQTAQSQVNQDDEDRKKLLAIRKRNLIRFGSLAVLAFVVWLFATISWFSSNKDVGAGGMGVRIGSNDFELRVVGDNVGALSYTQQGYGQQATYTSQEIYGLASNDSYLKGLKYGVVTGTNTYDTNDVNSQIKWRLSENYSAAEDKGLGPDSQGKLTFSVVPKRSGELNPSFALKLEGYKADNQKKNEDGSYQVFQNHITPITSSSDASAQKGVAHLNSHILFFKSRTNIGTEQNPVYAYSGLLDKDAIELKDIVAPSLLTGGKLIATENTPIPATIYWIWPNTFGQMVFAGNENSNRTPVGANSTDRAEIQNYILNNLLTVFDESAFNFESGTTDAQKIAAIRDKMTYSSGSGDDITYTFNGDTVNSGSNLSELTLGYNSADQKIGTNVNYVLLVLSLK